MKNPLLQQKKSEEEKKEEQERLEQEMLALQADEDDTYEQD